MSQTYRDLYNRETNLMIEENRVMKERRAADRKAQTYRRRADRAQSTAAYNRVLANAQPHFDAWSALNARCNEISAELRAIRAAMKELDPS